MYHVVDMVRIEISSFTFYFSFTICLCLIISRAHQLALERGEKLSQLEERAERMSNQAQEFSGTAHSLMQKYKDKKWYQL